MKIFKKIQNNLQKYVINLILISEIFIYKGTYTQQKISHLTKIIEERMKNEQAKVRFQKKKFSFRKISNIFVFFLFFK